MCQLGFRHSGRTGGIRTRRNDDEVLRIRQNEDDRSLGWLVRFADVLGVGIEAYRAGERLMTVGLCGGVCYRPKRLHVFGRRQAESL